MSDPYINLHVHSDFSRLDGAASIRSYVARAKALEQTHLAITDHGSMSSHWDMWRECKAAGITPILGIECYVAPAGRHVKEQVYFGTPEQRKLDVSSKGKYTHMTLLALNVTGLRNLYRMHKIASTEGFYGSPRIDVELMRQYHEGVLATSGCAASQVSTYLRLGQWENAVAYAREMQEIFGKENFYIEVMDHGIDEEDLNDVELNGLLIKVAEEIDAPLVATNDAHYCNPDDNLTHDAFLCLQTGAQIKDEKRFRFNGEGYHLKSAFEMRTKGSIPDIAITNTLKIAERVEEYDEHFAFKNRMPNLPEVDPEFEDDALEELVNRALDLHGLGEEYRKRAAYELEIISTMGFSGYFIVLADIIGWAKSNQIRVGPGRGSAGGSLVCFLVGITGIDPIVHGLPFERFLNPDRVSLPDIDIDFEIERRGEVVEYARSRFGEDHVSKILTLGTIKAKAAMKDAARVLGYGFGVADSMNKLFPPPIHGFQPSLSCVFDPEDKRYKDAENLRRGIDTNPVWREVYDLACKIEGLIRNFGVHAGGVIISSEPLQDVIPLKMDLEDGMLITGFDQPAMEPMGLIKYDFLGVENLTIINRALDHIENLYGEKVVVEDLPLDDPKAFSMLAKGNSLGVFQLDSPGMRRLLKRLAPKKFSDISAVLALYRPGPMGVDAHNDFADRANGRQAISLFHPEFEEPLSEILAETYGVIVYQEQIMNVLQVVAGYTPGQSDNVRRIMGKKKPAEMAKLEPELRERLKANGYSDEAFEALWEVLVPFADYSFNKAHTAAYGLVSYWTAYLKANYPIAYFAALLSAEVDDQEKLSIYLEDARSLGVQILPPDINESDYGFTPTKAGIRFGLSAIKQVGGAIIDEVRSSRYATLNEFYYQIPEKINTRSLQALIAAGAFDSFGDRATHFENAPDWLERARQHRKDREAGNILAITPDHTLPAEQIEKDQMRTWESEYLGVLLTMPVVKVEMSRGLSEMEWDWVNKLLSQHPGTERIHFELGKLRFTSGQKITPSARLVRLLKALDALTPSLD